MISEVVIHGSAGRIEGRYCAAPNIDAPIALVLHPHVLHGGHMNNKVVRCIFDSLREAGFSILRINFRGAGKSQGEFDNGSGELLDAATALDWLQSRHPEASNCWLAGFAFGAYVTLQLGMRRPEIAGLVALTPPANMYDFNFISPSPTHTLIVQGTADKVVPEDSVYRLYTHLKKQRNSNIEYFPISDADHCFSQHMDEVRTLISSVVRERLNSIDSSIGTKKRAKRKKHVGNLSDVFENV